MGFGLSDPDRSLPTWDILWFSETLVLHVIYILSGRSPVDEEQAGTEHQGYWWVIWLLLHLMVSENHTIIQSWNHRMAWVEKDHSDHLISTPCYVQGRQPPDQAAQSHIQPSLECLQGWGTHNLLGQPVPTCPVSHPSRPWLELLINNFSIIRMLREGFKEVITCD